MKIKDNTLNDVIDAGQALRLHLSVKLTSCPSCSGSGEVAPMHTDNTDPPPEPCRKCLEDRLALLRWDETLRDALLP